ncbi:MAG TPA: hypothetical protein VMU51_15085 [Mycobacteriales bacterium]|nr:hypothetical protein [Mycobacteriales bacterium]
MPEVVDLLLTLKDPDGRPEQLEESTAEVGAELAGFAGVRESAAVPPPAQSRGIEPVALGVLLVTVARSPEVLRALVSVLESWLAGRRQRTAEIEIDGDRLTLTGMDRREQQRLLEALLSRHRGKADDGGSPA